MALAVGSKSKRQGRTEVFWAVGRVDRYRICAELVQLAGHVVVVCRSQADAARVADELSRHGVPAASIEHRDFAAPHIRAQVVTDETALSCTRNGARCVIQFDPASGPRRYRRRVDLLAAPRAVVVTLVVPEHSKEALVLLADLDLPEVIGGADLAVACRAIAAARDDETSHAKASGTADRSAPHHVLAPLGVLARVTGGVLARVTDRARRAVRVVVGLVRDREHGTTVRASASGDETAFHGDQRAS